MLTKKIGALAAALFVIGACHQQTRTVGTSELYQQQARANVSQYQYPETRDLVALVDDAASLVQSNGEAAFADFRVEGSRWRRGESYVFVLDPRGDMLVHPDKTMEGKNELDLKDVNGKPIIRGLVAAATALPNKPEGFYHYEWPVPGGLLPRWKSSYVRLVTAPSGARYIVGSGMYDDRMERSFVVDLVKDAVGEIEQHGAGAFASFRDPKDRFMAKDAYVFVLDPNGVDLVNPAFPTLEGRNLSTVKDARGDQPIRRMIDLARTRGEGWVEYMWPKPGESAPTQKSAYVSRAHLGGSWVIVGSGVYLPGAPKSEPIAAMTAPALVSLVRDGAALLEKEGRAAYPEFRRKGSKWLRDDTYFFVLTMDGVRKLHAADPSREGTSARDAKDALGRPYGQMFLNIAASPQGEGWVHYMYQEPGDIFPVWKSAYLKRVTFPSGEKRIVGCGVYNMKMDDAMIRDVVDRAAELVSARGKNAFDALRDKRGAFRFMDTYVFVEQPDGVEVVNPAQPSLEGKSLLGVRDANGKLFDRDLLGMAMKNGQGWVEYEWYKPGDNAPAHKRTYVRKVVSGRDVYVVGSGYYVE